MSEGQYVYAVVAHGATLPAGLTGLMGESLATTACRDLAAVTSRVEASTVTPDVESVMRHEAVVEAIRERVPALPVRFGTIFRDAASLERALDRRYEPLASDLARLGDKVELGLSVLWNDSDGDEEEPEVSRRGPGPGSAYLWARVQETRRGDAHRAKARKVAEDLQADLAPLVLDQRQTLAPTARLVVRAAYLLEPETVETFKGAFELVRQRRLDLRFLLSGPWPPYTFVSSDSMDGAFSALARAVDPTPLT